MLEEVTVLQAVLMENKKLYLVNIGKKTLKINFQNNYPNSKYLLWVGLLA